MCVQSAIGAAVATITKTVTVAAGVFAAGHLGELTQVVPFELADGVVADARAGQRRVRLLPSRVGIYFVLACATRRELFRVEVKDRHRRAVAAA